MLGSCLLLAACAAPVPDEGAYRHAALQTSMAMVSALASGQLAARTDLRGNSFSPFTDGNVTDAENDADSVNSTFSSRQPPDARSDVLRQKMLQALSDGTSALTDLRVAVRMGDRTRVRKALAEVGKSLKTFDALQQELQ
ncbi:MAG TPA: hypothetical protein VFV73_05260 [Streptosporangiaceae bacterium]|nr:hypothetical protein [Streptosporangiaceae bacterium]